MPLDGVPARGNAVRAAPKGKGARRLVFLKWLRLTHLYLGLWGAVMGLLFGATGILLNHRSILMIPVEKSVQTTAQLPLPAAGVSRPEELSRWLQTELKFTPTHAPLVRSEPAKEIVWGNQQVRQPERWTISLQSPQRAVNAEYFVGNRFVKLSHIDATIIGTLTRLHMATGVNVFWVLLSDTLAGALIVLSITGLLLWSQLRRIRTIAVLTSIGAVLAGVAFVLTSL